MNIIKTQGESFKDEYGRERIFNGINICDKGWYDPEKGKRIYGNVWKKGLAGKLKNCGLNLIRLGFTWDAVEPVMGKYDETFLDYLRDILDECAENDVYVYLDMHQDLYSGFGDGCGDGAPAWATLTDGYEYKKARFVWAEGYFWGRAVHRAFDNFWSNKKLDGIGIADRYINMWLHVIERLGDHSAVIGFDVMNEPFPGKDGGKIFVGLVCSFVRKTLCDNSIDRKKLIKCAAGKDAFPKISDIYGGEQLKNITSAGNELIKKFDTERYYPFMKKITKAIRNAGNDKIILMENSYFSNLGIPYSCPVPVVDGKKDPSVVFAPHAYDFMVDTPQYKYASNDRIKAIFDEHKNSQKRLSVPVIVGEWGGFTEGNEWFPHIKFLLKLFDSNKWSHTYWSYFDGVENSDLFSDVLVRPAPVAVAGKINSYWHDREESSFTLLFSQDPDCAVPSEIFLPSLPKSVETDTGVEHKTEKYGEAFLLKFTAGPGNHKIKVML